MKNICMISVMFVLMLFMSMGYAGNFDDHLDNIDDYEKCIEAGMAFSGGPECDEPEDYNPCQTEFSGGECEPPSDDTCAVFVQDSGNLHIKNTYLDGSDGVSLPYIKMVHKDGVFYVEEIEIDD